MRALYDKIGCVKMSDDISKMVKQEYAKRELEGKEIAEFLNKREIDLSNYRKTLQLRESELEEYKNKLERDSLEREESFRRELKHRERMFEERERELFARQSNIEKRFKTQFEETEKLREQLQNELLKKDEELKKLILETEKEKEKYREESRKTIESKSRKFVQSALQLLQDKEEKFRFFGTAWSVVGAVSIASGIIFAVVVMISGADNFHQAQDAGISYYLYVLFRGIIVIGLFAALARYAFIYGNAFMHESLKNGERLHAIKFGEFYLDAYGADANWDTIKDAFSNWNLSSHSAFSSDQDSKFSTNAIKDVLDGAANVGEKIRAKE